jgi:large subunit ribosomal protein L23Ae
MDDFEAAARAVSRMERKVKKSKVGVLPPREKRAKGEQQRRQLAIKKALTTQKKVIKDKAGDRSHARKIRTTVRFKRPRTFRPPRNPKFPRKAVPKRNRMDAFSIIDYPIATESSMKKIEDQNTLVFIVHPKATKIHVKAAVMKLFNVTVKKVNTLVRPDGKKKAYVKLAPEHDALDVANKLGII